MPAKRSKQRADFSEDEWQWGRGERSSYLGYILLDKEKAELWRSIGDQIVRDHIKQWPGSRPLRWWQRDATEPRRQLGGTGEYMPTGEYCLREPTPFGFDGPGVPDVWLSVDPNDPPRFESEPAYLLRLGLLTPGERRRLRLRDFEPEILGEPD